MDLTRFKALPILGILRGVEADAIEPLAETVAAAGLRAVEITMNTAGAAELIRRLSGAAAGRFAVGAGTVLGTGPLEAALGAGATFIVSPTLVPEVVAACVARKTPVFPGAMTPQEIYTAWRAGATMVKVFPAGRFGPEYFKEVKGPFNDIELLACGGVKAENIGAYFGCGASAVAFGAGIFRAEWLAGGEFARIGEAIVALIAAYGRIPRPT